MAANRATTNTLRILIHIALPKIVSVISGAPSCSCGRRRRVYLWRPL
jgi:hypothetical protein